jgi:hypothetical protein
MLERNDLELLGRIPGGVALHHRRGQMPVALLVFVLGASQTAAVDQIEHKA